MHYERLSFIDWANMFDDYVDAFLCEGFYPEVFPGLGKGTRLFATGLPTVKIRGSLSTVVRVPAIPRAIYTVDGATGVAVFPKKDVRDAVAESKGLDIHEGFPMYDIVTRIMVKWLSSMARDIKEGKAQ